jgi:hypothetical protein
MAAPLNEREVQRGRGEGRDFKKKSGQHPSSGSVQTETLIFPLLRWCKHVHADRREGAIRERRRATTVKEDSSAISLPRRMETFALPLFHCIFFCFHTTLAAPK